MPYAFHRPSTSSLALVPKDLTGATADTDIELSRDRVGTANATASSKNVYEAENSNLLMRIIGLCAIFIVGM